MQQDLEPRTEVNGPVLAFDFPALHVGVAEYREGPTGVTVFRFPDQAVGVVDVRGGAPGTYNVDWLRLGYEHRNLDCITVAGGSWYGLAAAGGVAGALKTSGVRGGHWSNLANVTGAIIYDYGDRRLNEIHPDERLGSAAFQAAQPGRFPLGAQGAGRMTMQGSYFGLWLHSGQGGAFRQVGPTKIAAFSVVNSVGAIVGRNGQLVHGGQPVPTGETTIGELLQLLPDQLRSSNDSILGVRSRAKANPANTTISVLVTNQKLAYSQLQRLAIQVHTSMGRAIQPFATANDGDVFFAVSTDEIENPDLHPTDLGTIASETMWDAVLASVPDIANQPKTCPRGHVPLKQCTGSYRFAPGVELGVTEIGAKTLSLQVEGEKSVYGKGPRETWQVELQPDGSFASDDLYLQGGQFELGDDSQPPSLVLNPGLWEQRGLKSTR